MQVQHKFMIHAICPFIEHRRVWDYYDCIVRLNRVVDVHQIEAVISDHAGVALSQESLCQLLQEKLRPMGIDSVELLGRHSANSRTVVVCGAENV